MCVGCLFLRTPSRAPYRSRCVECLFFRSPGHAPYGANPACAKRATTRTPSRSCPSLPSVPKLPMLKACACVCVWCDLGSRSSMRCQAMRVNVCAAAPSVLAPCEESEKYSIEYWLRQSRLYTRHKSLTISYILNPFFTTPSRSLYYRRTISTPSTTQPRCAYPNQLSIRDNHLSIRESSPSPRIPSCPDGLYRRGWCEPATVRSRPASARTILLFHIISARPSKQPRMVGSTLGVYSFGLIFVSARTNKRHHHHHEALLPGSGLGTNCLQTLGSSPGLFRVPYCV